MKTASGSILILAAAILLQPAMKDQGLLADTMAFAGPMLITGVVLMVIGLRTSS